MKYSTVLIASVLKPIFDTRMYEKIGRTLSADPDCQVHIFGIKQEASSKKENNIHLHPHSITNEEKFGRIKALLQYWYTLKKVQPTLTIPSTPDLLLITIIWRTFHNCKVVYDVRENYALNRKNRSNKSSYFNTITWLWEKLEYWSASKSDLLIAAEVVYPKQLRFLKKAPFVLVQNKAAEYHNPIPKNKQYDFVYTGTIADEYGIWEALNFIRSQIKLRPKTKALIIGHTTSSKLREQLKEQVQHESNITLVTALQPLPHQQILEAIAETNFLLMPYKNLVCFDGKTPTKLFEAMSLGTNVISQTGHSWNKLIEEHSLGIMHDFNSDEPLTIDLKQFSPINLSKETWSWETEKTKLTEMLG